MNNKIIKIPLTILRDAQLKLDEVADLLQPYFATLSPPERQSLVKIGVESFKFIEMSYEFAVTNPELFPSFMKVSIFGEEFFLTQQLWALAGKLKNLQNSICDTEMAAGNHAMRTALAFYQMVKIAARRDIPGARIVFEELKPRRPSGIHRRDL